MKLRFLETLARATLPIAMLLAASGANACIVDTPLIINDIKDADAVFVGSIVRYEIFSPGEPYSLDDYGIVTVRVRERLKGDVPNEVELYWWNSTFGMPEAILTSDPALFAAARSDSSGLPFRGGSATIFPNKRPDLFRVLQAPCSSGFILPYGRSTAQAVKGVLEGKTNVPSDENKVDESLTYREFVGVHSEERSPRLSALKVIALLAVIACVLGMFAWSRHRRRAVTE